MYIYSKYTDGLGDESMLELVNVTKEFKNSGFAAKDISFHLPKGYIMGLIGENGAGKSTIIKCILGLYRPDQGEIVIDGMQYAEHEKEIKNAIGFVLAEDMFPRNMSIANIARSFGKFYENFDYGMWQQYCERFGLSVTCKYQRLSKGERLKFQFAFALAHKPKLLVLDEPSAHFDPEFRKEFLKELSHFVEDGEHSVLLATHIMEDVEQLGDYITFVQDGTILFSEDREILQERYRLVTGEACYIRQLDKEKIIYQEDGTYGSRALVYHKPRSTYHQQLTVEVPGLNALFYGIEKGRQAQKNGRGRGRC